MRSEKLGGASLGIFFGVFFLVGCASLGLMLGSLTLPDLRANLNFQKTTCKVLDRRIDVSEDGMMPVYRPELEIEYEVGGTAYRRWAFDSTHMYQTDADACQQMLDQFETGKTYPCWYDPRNAFDVVVVRGHRWYAWLALMLPASFLAIGGAGLVFTLLTWNKSSERRAVWARRAARFDPFEMSGAEAQFPTVPTDTHITNSPGTRLAYRLPLAIPGWQMLGMLLAAVFWNGVVLIFVSMAAEKHWAGVPDWSFTLLLMPFIGVGAGLIALVVRQVRGRTTIGATILEIDEHPLVPGRRYRVFLAQSGQVTFEQYQLSLVCDEEVKYLQGTNLRMAQHRTCEHVLLSHRNLSVTHESRFETQVEFAVPQEAMHSFQSTHHRIGWKLEVRARVAGQVEINRQFLVVVSPALPTRRPSARVEQPQTV